MPRPQRIEYENTFYHGMNRGEENLINKPDAFTSVALLLLLIFSLCTAVYKKTKKCG